ncbi:MAG: type IV secretion system protein [Treponemataceae bacterium]|nr:type IV secretion system protein [Treponemataceae bacterium]
MSVKNFSPQGEPVTAFNSERNSTNSMQLAHFDFICGQVMQENRILKYVVIVSCLAFFVSIGITLYAVSLPKSIPVLVTMNDFGEASYVGAVSRRSYQNFSVPEIAVQYQVKKFVNLRCTLSTDRAVMKKSVSETYHLLTSTTAAKYSAWLKEENPFADFGSRTREVFFQTEPLQLSRDTYQVDFQVTTRQLSGAVADSQTFRAVISVKTLQPSEEDIRDNPLGIYITAFDFKEIYSQKS